LAAGNTNIVSRGISVIGEDYHYHARELGVGVGLLSMRSRSNTAEYGADALANWFLSSLDEEFEKINQVQEQLDDLMDRTVCGGEFTDYYGQTQILLGGSILTR